MLAEYKEKKTYYAMKILDKQKVPINEDDMFSILDDDGCVVVF